MNPVRLGIIGCGGMARMHMGYFDKLPNLLFTAAADTDPTALDLVHSRFPNVKLFADGLALLDSGLIDAVLIATPHYFHTTFAIAAFQRNIHVLSEKPVAVTAQAAQEAIDAHQKHHNVLYAAMFQQRTLPGWKKVKQLIDSGAIGQIVRVNWIITDWFRTQAYYNSGGWRATWAGEGGGVLLNQCPHNLDLFQWFVGLPSTVSAFVGIGKHHDIEVEDEVTAYMDFPNGATGVFITSTGEAPGTNRLMISGDKGQLLADGSNTIQLIANESPMIDFRKTSTASFATPTTSRITIQAGGEAANPPHRTITENFLSAIQHGTPLIAPAAEGIRGLELGNAMLMSGLTHQPVPLPTPRNAYADLIQTLAKTSKFQKQTITQTSDALDSSWKK